MPRVPTTTPSAFRLNPSRVGRTSRMCFPGCRWLRVSLLLGAGLLAGCQSPRADSLPSFAPPPNPHLAAQTALIRDARAHLDSGQAESAIPLLRTLIERHPESPLLPDMRWWLGRAYELAGDPEAAADLYQRLIHDTPGTGPSHRRLIGLAQRRLAVLAPSSSRDGARPTSGLLVLPAEVPAGPERAAWLDALARAGFTALVVEAASPPTESTGAAPETAEPGDPTTPPRAGVYFRTSWAPVIDDLIEQLVPLARERGLAVYAALAPRRLSWLEPPAAWADVTFDPEQGALRRTSALDLFHPGFQQYLEGLLLDLADSHVDGIVLRAMPPLGPADGFTAFARAGFERAFRLPVEPARWLADRLPMQDDASGADRLVFESADRYPPAFWRWVGWKARERLAVLTRLAERLRSHRVETTVGLEIHPASVGEPSEALVTYAEDVVAIARAGFDHVLVPSVVAASPQPVADGAGRPEPLSTPGATGLARLIEIFGDPARIWLMREGTEVMNSTRVPGPAGSVDRASLPQGVGILQVPTGDARP